MGGEVTPWFICVSNVVGAKILAAIKLVISIGNIVLTGIAINATKSGSGPSHDWDEIGNGILRFFLISVAAIGIIDDIILMIGAFKKKRILLIIWMIIAACITVVGIFTIFWYIAFEYGYR